MEPKPNLFAMAGLTTGAGTQVSLSLATAVVGERQPLAAVFGVGQRLGSRYFAQLHGSKVSIWRIG